MLCCLEIPMSANALPHLHSATQHTPQFMSGDRTAHLLYKFTEHYFTEHYYVSEHYSDYRKCKLSSSFFAINDKILFGDNNP